MAASGGRVDDGVKKPKALCWFILLSSGIIYGSSFSWMKVAVLNGANPLGMVFWFAAIASVVLGAVLCVRRKFREIRIALLWICIPWAVLSVILPNVFFFYAAREIQSSLIALGIALVPILTLIGAVFLKRDFLSFGRLAGICLGGLGVGLILVPNASLPESADAVFVAIAFLGAACYAAEHLYIEVKVPEDISIEVLLFLVFLSAAIIMVPIVAYTGTLIYPSWPMTIMEYAVLSVSFVTLLDYFFITLLILWAGPVFTSQAAYIVTLAGIVWGMSIFGERHSVWIWAAIACLMVGLFLVRPRKLKANRILTPAAGAAAAVEGADGAG